MTITRSVARRQSNAEYAAVRSAYRWDFFLNGVHEFVQAVSTSLATTDLAQLTGIALSTAFAATAASAASLFLIAFPIVCGVICVRFIVRDLINRRNAELNLRQECHAAKDKQADKVQAWLNALKKLLAVKEDVIIRERYKLIRNGGDIDKATKELNGYLKHKMHENFPDIVRPQRSEAVVVNGLLPINDLSWERTAIAFFSGSGAMFGACVTVAGVVLTTPVGWGALALIAVLSITIGAIMSYADYRQSARQKQHMERLEQRKHDLFASNKRLDKSIKMIEGYTAVLLLQIKPSEETSDDEVELMDEPNHSRLRQRHVEQNDVPPLFSLK